MLTKPRWMLHLEGAAILGVALYFYRAGAFSLVALRLALPVSRILSMLGLPEECEVGRRSLQPGSHPHAAAAVALGVLAAWRRRGCIPYALIWLAHIGFDRALGFGLKYPTFFKDTHLQHV